MPAGAIFLRFLGEAGTRITRLGDGLNQDGSSNRAIEFIY
jgi:hypothetical protein